MEALSPEELRALETYAKIDHQQVFLTKEQADRVSKGVLMYQRRARRIRHLREFVQRHAPCLSGIVDRVLRWVYTPKPKQDKFCK